MLSPVLVHLPTNQLRLRASGSSVGAARMTASASVCHFAPASHHHCLSRPFHSTGAPNTFSLGRAAALLPSKRYRVCQKMRWAVASLDGLDQTRMGRQAISTDP